MGMLRESRAFSKQATWHARTENKAMYKGSSLFYMKENHQENYCVVQKVCDAGLETFDTNWVHKSPLQSVIASLWMTIHPR